MMIKLLSHHRVRIPNSLAIAAALLLVTSSIVGFESTYPADSEQAAGISRAQASSAGTDSIEEPGTKKPQKLNIGSLLFRRG